MRLSVFLFFFALFLCLSLANVIVITKGYTTVNQYFSFVTIGLNILGVFLAVLIVWYCIYSLDFYSKVREITISQWEKGCSSSSECVKRIIEGCSKSKGCSL